MNTFFALLLASLVGGTGFISNTIHGGSQHSHDFKLVGKQKTVITVFGDKKGSIECELFDANAKSLAQNSTPDDTCKFEWTPKTTVTLTLLVKNNGKEPDHYTVIAQ